MEVVWCRGEVVVVPLIGAEALIHLVRIVERQTARAQGQSLFVQEPSEGGDLVRVRVRVRVRIRVRS